MCRITHGTQISRLFRLLLSGTALQLPFVSHDLDIWEEYSPSILQGVPQVGFFAVACY